MQHRHWRREAPLVQARPGKQRLKDARPEHELLWKQSVRHTPAQSSEKAQGLRDLATMGNLKPQWCSYGIEQSLLEQPRTFNTSDAPRPCTLQSRSPNNAVSILETALDQATESGGHRPSKYWRPRKCTAQANRCYRTTCGLIAVAKVQLQAERASKGNLEPQGFIAAEVTALQKSNRNSTRTSGHGSACTAGNLKPQWISLGRGTAREYRCKIEATV